MRNLLNRVVDLINGIWDAKKNCLNLYGVKCFLYGI